MTHIQQSLTRKRNSGTLSKVKQDKNSFFNVGTIALKSFVIATLYSGTLHCQTSCTEQWTVWFWSLAQFVMSFERYSHTLYFWELSWNIDAFYHTMKRVSISVFTDFSQSSLFAMRNGNPIKRGEEFPQSSNRSSARWRYFITTTRILQGFTFLCKLEPLLFKLRWDYQIYKNERNSNEAIV